MQNQSSFPAKLFSLVIGVLFLTMTAAFITIPYNLSEHPGDTNAKVASVTARHLS